MQHIQGQARSQGRAKGGRAHPLNVRAPPADFDTEHQLGVSKMQQNVYLQLRNTLYSAVFADAVSEYQAAVGITPGISSV